MKRISIPNVDSFLTAIPAEIKQTQDTRYAHRLEVVRFVLKGHSPDEAAKFFQHSPRSIHNWLHRLADQGPSRFGRYSSTRAPASPVGREVGPIASGY